jgi:hypothetical protein
MWTPGYWSYGAGGYFWVPGAWVPAPYVGALWTPGYWGWSGGRYIFNLGYWGPHVGFYGGVNYGFGYGGIGFAGGMWRGGVFAYNSAVMHVGVGFHSVYMDRGAVDRGFVARDSHVAFSGGPGGIHHDPSPEERMAAHDQHRGPTAMQSHHEGAARSDTTSYASNNGGHPAHVAEARPMMAENHGAAHTNEMHTTTTSSHTMTTTHTVTQSRPAAESHPAAAPRGGNERASASKSSPEGRHK